MAFFCLSCLPVQGWNVFGGGREAVLILLVVPDSSSACDGWSAVLGVSLD